MVHLAIDPVAFWLGPVAVHWHGITVASALALALVVLEAEARRVGLDLARLHRGALWVIIAGLAGARLFHVADHADYYLNHPAALLAVQEGGSAISGGVVAGIVAGAIYARRAGLPFWRTADAAAPAAILGLGLGRLGCLVNGDAWGAPADLPWAVVYDRPDALLPASLVGVPTHPYPAYELLWDLGVFALLWRRRRRAPGTGVPFLSFVVLYALGRFALAFVRQEPVVAFGLQQAQLLAFAMLIVALPLLVGRWRAALL